jgi:MHS family proline/betaine transporter-like MFS transporter
MVPILVLFALIEPFIAASVYTMVAEIFPGRVRYTGTSLGFNLGAIAAAGFGPYICGQFVSSTGWAPSPGIWGTFCALLGLIAVSVTAETSRTQLVR